MAAMENSDVGEGNDGQDGDNDGGEGNDGQEDDNSDPMIPEYIEHPGCISDMTEKSPLDFFQLFVTDEMLEAITEQTKLFAQQYIDSHEFARRSRVQQWVRSAHVHDVAELKKFLAMVIIMGLISYPSIEDYVKNEHSRQNYTTDFPFMSHYNITFLYHVISSSSCACMSLRLYCMPKESYLITIFNRLWAQIVRPN